MESLLFLASLPSDGEPLFCKEKLWTMSVISTRIFGVETDDAAMQLISIILLSSFRDPKPSFRVRTISKSFQ